MNIRDLIDLIDLRRHMYDIEQGQFRLNRAMENKVGANRKKLDSVLLDCLADEKLLDKLVLQNLVHTVSTSEADFEAASKMVLESKLPSEVKPTAEVKVDEGGVVLASAKEDVPTESVVETGEVKLVKAKEEKKKGSFRRE